MGTCQSILFPIIKPGFESNHGKWYAYIVGVEDDPCRETMLLVDTYKEVEKGERYENRQWLQAHVTEGTGLDHVRLSAHSPKWMPVLLLERYKRYIS